MANESAAYPDNPIKSQVELNPDTRIVLRGGLHLSVCTVGTALHDNERVYCLKRDRH